jgi:hypothetical protein
MTRECGEDVHTQAAPCAGPFRVAKTNTLLKYTEMQCWCWCCRYDPSTGMLSLVCNRFPTREENRRWCLEVLHRLLQEGQSRHPSKHFLLGPRGAAAAQQAAATAALP